MKLFGCELTLSRGCPDCARLERENSALRLQMRMMGEHQVGLLDEIHKLRGERAVRLEEQRRHADMVTSLADLQRAPL